MNSDKKIIITDRQQVITATEFWDPKLVVMAQVPDHEIQKQTLKQYLKQYSAKVLWTYDEKTIAAVVIPDEKNLTMFMLANSELYHFKQRFWDNHARDFWAEIDEEIQTHKNNLEEAQSRKQLLEKKGPVAYRKHVEKIYGVRSTILKNILKGHKLTPLGKLPKKPKKP